MRKKLNNSRRARRREAEKEQRNATPLPSSPAAEAMPATPAVVKEAEAHIAKQIATAAADDQNYRKQAMGLEKWQHRFTAALVFAAFAQIFTATWQGCTMREQMRQAEKQIKIALTGQRAWLGVSKIVEVKHGDHSDYDIYAKNAGQTPAFVVAQFNCIADFVDYAPGREFTPDNEGLVQDMLSKSVKSSIFDYDGSVLPATEVRLTKAHKHGEYPTFAIVCEPGPNHSTGKTIRRFVFGMVKYKDATDTLRVTTYCFEVADEEIRTFEKYNKME
jgi:hypothetical protein